MSSHARFLKRGLPTLLQRPCQTRNGPGHEETKGAWVQGIFLRHVELAVLKSLNILRQNSGFQEYALDEFMN